MRLKSEEMKSAIFGRALTMFGENGYEDVAMKDISDSLGISKGIVFHYHKSKDELYLACVKQFVCDFNCYLENFLKRPGGVDFQGEDAGFGIRKDFLSKYPQYVRIFSDTIQGKPKKLKNDILQLRDSIFCQTKRLYDKMLANVKLGKGISNDDAILLFSIIQYSMADIIEMKDASDTDGFIFRIFRIFINGLSVDIE